MNWVRVLNNQEQIKIVEYIYGFFSGFRYNCVKYLKIRDINRVNKFNV